VGNNAADARILFVKSDQTLFASLHRANRLDQRPSHLKAEVKVSRGAAGAAPAFNSNFNFELDVVKINRHRLLLWRLFMRLPIAVDAFELMKSGPQFIWAFC
jgi:hypothetical protein